MVRLAVHTPVGGPLAGLPRAVRPRAGARRTAAVLHERLPRGPDGAADGGLPGDRHRLRRRGRRVVGAGAGASALGEGTGRGVPAGARVLRALGVEAALAGAGCRGLHPPTRLSTQAPAYNFT